jgi:hypothetical protein
VSRDHRFDTLAARRGDWVSMAIPLGKIKKSKNQKIKNTLLNE